MRQGDIAASGPGEPMRSRQKQKSRSRRLGAYCFCIPSLQVVVVFLVLLRLQKIFTFHGVPFLLSSLIVGPSYARTVTAP
jgi:hypothetical protein